MAAWDKWEERYTKPLHLQEVVDEYSPTAGTDPIPTALAGISTDLQTQIDAIDAYILANGEVGSGLTDIRDALVVIKDTDTAGVISDYGNKPTHKDIVDVCSTVKAALVAKINVTRGDADTRCAGKGWYFKSQDTGDSGDAATKKLCTSCKATGYLVTGTSNTPTVIFPISDQEPDEELVQT